MTKIENFDNLIDIKDAKIRQKLKTIYRYLVVLRITDYANSVMQ